MKRHLVLILCLIALLILAGGFYLTNRQTEPIPYQLPPAKSYPEVADLAPDAVGERRLASLSYGVHTFLWWNSTYRSWDLENIRLMNFGYVKESFAWSNIQGERDMWDWSLADEVVAEAEHRGVQIMARIDDPPTWAIQPKADVTRAPYDLAAFEIYCRTLSERYQGQIDAYQVWNEPNLTREWAEQPPNPAAYVELLAACARGLRAGDAEALIISAGLSPTGTRDLSALPDEEYLWEMYAAGVSPHFDVLGLHAPGYSLPPETSAEEAQAQDLARWARFRHVEDMRAIMVANGDAHKQIAITEMGWTTDSRSDSIYSWFGVSAEQQADYLVRAYAYAAEHWRPWVGLMVTIYISKDIWTSEDEQWWWAVDEPAEPGIWKIMRPAYYALANMAKFSDNPAFAEPARDPNVRPQIDPLPPRR